LLAVDSTLKQKHEYFYQSSAFILIVINILLASLVKLVSSFIWREASPPHSKVDEQDKSEERLFSSEKTPLLPKYYDK
jgi:hypothetical protein